MTDLSSYEEVTTVIPAFNAAYGIDRAVTSAFAAGAQGVIVVDDGSIDNTFEVATAAGAEVVSQANSGAAKARLLGLSRVTTRLVNFLDADDEVVAPGFRRSATIFSEVPDVVGVVGATEWIRVDAQSSISKPRPYNSSVEALIQNGYAPAPPGSVIWRTDAVNEAFSDGPAPILPRFADDYELFLRVARRGPIVTHEIVSSKYRATGGKSTRNRLEVVKAAEAMRLYYGAELGVPVTARGTRELNSLVLRRVALEFPSRSYSRIIWTIRAYYLSPISTLQRVIGRVHQAPLIRRCSHWLGSCAIALLARYRPRSRRLKGSTGSRKR